jgi:hypothetical protein
VGLAATHDEQMPHAGAGSGGGRNSAISRRMSANNVLGMATSVGNTVDVANASYTNMIGDAFLAAYWVDEDFDPESMGTVPIDLHVSRSSFFSVNDDRYWQPKAMGWTPPHLNGIKVPDWGC